MITTPIQATTKQYKYETSTIQTFKRPSHNKENQHMEREQEQQGQVSKKHNEYT
jgi:hypothetical protein